MRCRVAWQIALIGAGCAQSITVGDPDSSQPDGGGDAGSAFFGTYSAFTTVTRGENSSGWDNNSGFTLVVIGTTLPVASGCPLVTVESSSPAQAASLVFAQFHKQGLDEYCAPGAYPINQDTSQCFPGAGIGCAVFKKWDAAGTLRARVLAIGGFVTVEQINIGYGARRCLVNVSLAFPGGSYDDAFAVDYTPPSGSPTASGPLCTSAACSPLCADWEVCTSTGCQNAPNPCIDSQVSCPISQPPACCATPTLEFSCNATTDGARCCIPRGSACEFARSGQCCPGLRCELQGCY